MDQALLNYKDKIDKLIKQQEDDLKKHEEERAWMVKEVEVNRAKE